MLQPNIHILGIQGSGKGTQSALLVEKYHFLYLASGNLFRARAAKGDDLGLKIGSEMQAGRLLPDAYLYHTIIDVLDEKPHQQGILGDGVIRTITQYAGLEPVWGLAGLDAPILVHLVLDEQAALDRIKNRQRELEAATPNPIYAGKLAHRTDDNPRAIEERFALYHEMTVPVISLFKEKNRCIEVDAADSVESIQSNIQEALEKECPILHVTH